MAFGFQEVGRNANGKVLNRLRVGHLSSILPMSIDQYEAQEAAAVRADDHLPLLEGLAPLVRSTHDLLETLEKACKGLPEERTLIDHRDRAYDLSRQAELLYEDARNSMDVAVIRRADEQANSSHQMTVAAHRLNMLAAMFFPFATLDAIFGTTLTDNWSWSHSALPFILFLMTGLWVLTSYWPLRLQFAPPAQLVIYARLVSRGNAEKTSCRFKTTNFYYLRIKFTTVPPF